MGRRWWFEKSAVSARESAVTDEPTWHARREWLAKSGALGIGGWLQGLGLAPPTAPQPARLPAARTVWRTTDAPMTPFEDIATYNNYYEFGTSKSDPAREAAHFPVRPWEIVVDGHCRKPLRLGIEALIALGLEDRVYRHRCVEAWSMVIPWRGVPLAAVLRRAAPWGSARFVSFTTRLDPAHMPGERSDILDWPYLEGLRLDEAMHPLTLLALGLYGRELPPQNGAPVRLVVPWKYGFKSAKAIVRIHLEEHQPVTTWMRAVPSRYGFYSNVNPAVDTVPWSQARERRIGEDHWRPTALFNGYGVEVASLYRGMDLNANY